MVDGPLATLERHRGEVTCLAYSPDGSMLASGDANREVLVWDASTNQVKKSRMVYHNARITALAWSKDSKEIASGEQGLREKQNKSNLAVANFSRVVFLCL